MPHWLREILVFLALIPSAAAIGAVVLLALVAFTAGR